MEIGTIGLRVASAAVAPLIRRLFRPEGPGAGLVDRPVRLASLVSFRGEKRTLTDRDLAKLATELTLCAAKAAGPHDTPRELDRIMVADLLARSLRAVGDLDMDDVQAVRLGPDALSRALRQNTDELSADATVFYDRVLALTCLHVLDFFTKRSTFVARTLVEQARQHDRIIHTLDLLVERVSSQSAEDAAAWRRPNAPHSTAATSRPPRRSAPNARSPAGTGYCCAASQAPARRPWCSGSP
ncbi:NACHT N-terminal Helical domain 1-containing protein [Streptomyces mayteni]